LFHSAAFPQPFAPPFFLALPREHFMADLHWMLHGSVAPARACSTGASCDRPAAKGAPLWAWAAFVSGPWPCWFLPPQLEPGLQSPPNSTPDPDSESANPQPLAHLPKLRRRHPPMQLLFRARFSYIHILPIRIQRHRYAVFLNPGSQHPHRCPDRLLTPHPRQRVSAGIGHHVHQTPSRPSFLQPGVETSIHLHQFSHVFFPLSPLAVHALLPRPTPQPFGQHPAPQGLRIHFHIIVTRQVLGRQRRPEPLSFLSGILLAH